jgi:predicted transcriptional regulator
VTITSKGKLTPREQRFVSHAAGRVLTHVDQARTALRFDKSDQAVAQVEKALALIKIIENAVPESDIKAVIKSGDVTYEDQLTVKPFLIPVYAELDETELALPSALKAKRDSAAQSDAAAELSIQYTAAFLDVKESKFGLSLALEELKNNEPAAADSRLGEVLQAVVFEYDELDAPLVKARRHVAAAERAFAHKEIAQAKDRLGKAAAALDAYASKAGAEAAQKVKPLTEETKTLAAKLDAKEASSTESLRNLWDKIVNLF